MVRYLAAMVGSVALAALMSGIQLRLDIGGTVSPAAAAAQAQVLAVRQPARSIQVMDEYRLRVTGTERIPTAWAETADCKRIDIVIMRPGGPFTGVGAYLQTSIDGVSGTAQFDDAVNKEQLGYGGPLNPTGHVGLTVVSFYDHGEPAVGAFARAIMYNSGPDSAVVDVWLYCVT